MTSYSKWLYNEMKQVGTDYADIAEVEAYDSQMQKVRDISQEITGIIDFLGLTHEQTVLEFGTGTGEFAIEAARHCKNVFAMDVSPAMLEYARKKAQSQGITNIHFHNAGFLTYEHKGEQPDAVVSQLALHHLPDFWKSVAIGRIFDMLKDGGKFYLMDVVYSFDMAEYESFFDNWIEGARQAVGDDFVQDTEVSIRDEYMTFDWIMEELLTRAGFHIEKADYHEGFIAVYQCTKIAD